MTSITPAGWIAWFARNPVAANLLMVMILAAGAMSVSHLRVEGFPTLPPTSVSVVVPYKANTAEDADEAVAQKIEVALRGTPGIKQIVTRSTTAQVELTIEKIDSIHIDQLLSDIKTRIDTIANLPDTAGKPIIKREEDLDYVTTVQVTGAVEFDVLLSVAQRLHQRLLADPNIDHVKTIGARTPELGIEISDAQLAAMNLTLADVAERINAFSDPARRSELLAEDRTFAINAGTQGRYGSDFSNIPLLAQPNGSHVRLGDVARLTEGYDADHVLSTFDSVPSIALEIEAGSDSHILNVAESVGSIIARFRKAELPAGVKVTTWYDTSDYIRDRLGLMVKNGIIGVLLVFVLLAVFLNLRVAFWVAAGLPVALGGAVLLLGDNAFGMTLNELTTFGFIMAFGIVVDDAVVVGESIYSKRHGCSVNVTDAIRGTQHVSTPIIFGVLTTVVAFSALAIVQGNMGKLFSQFALVVAFCLAFSLVESLFILPAHLAQPTQRMRTSSWRIVSLCSRFQSIAARFLESFIWNVYGPLLRRLVEYRYAVVALAMTVSVLVGGMLLTGQVRAVFFPDIPGNTVSVSLSMHEDAGYGLTHRAARNTEEAARAADRILVEEYDLHRPLIRNLYVSSDTTASASVVVELVPRQERPISTDEFAKRWRENTTVMEGVSAAEFITSWERTPDISIQLQASDLGTLHRANAELWRALGITANVANVRSTLRNGQSQLKVALNSLGTALGLTGATLGEQAQYLAEGYELQRFQRERDQVKVILRHPEGKRLHAAAIGNFRVQTPEGTSLPLGLVSDFEATHVADTIIRTGSALTAVVTADVDKKITSPDEVLDMLQTSVLRRLEEEHLGLSIFLDGEAEEQETATRSLAWAATLVLIAIYTLLAVPLRSYLQPLLIMSVIPFALVGAILGHWINGLPISLLSLFGILALNGIVVNDSLLLVSRFNQLTQLGAPLHDAICKAACHRMRAIVLTSVTTFVGLAPLMAEHAEQAQVLIPAAVSVGYGVLFATAVTLILLPLVTVILNDVSRIRGLARERNVGVAAQEAM